MTNPRVLGTLTTGLRPPHVWVLEETAGPESLGRLMSAVWGSLQQSALRRLWWRPRGRDHALLRILSERCPLLLGKLLCRLRAWGRRLLGGLLSKWLLYAHLLHTSAVEGGVTQGLALVTIRVSAHVTFMTRLLTHEAVCGALELVVAFQPTRIALNVTFSSPAPASATAVPRSISTLIRSGLSVVPLGCLLLLLGLVVVPLGRLLLLLRRIARRSVAPQGVD